MTAPLRRAAPALLALLCLLTGPGCVSARAEGPRPPPDAGTPAPAPAPAPVPRTRLECGPTEMECCGACVSRSEGRCPENIQCRTREAAPTQ